tara:strand:- start:193 stop:867 length:675 start_codon:yes stop_codon:yes gene_type:complete
MNHKLEKILAHWKEFNYTRDCSLPQIRLPSVNFSRKNIGKAVIGMVALGLVAGGVGVHKGFDCVNEGFDYVSQRSNGSLDDYLPKSFAGLKWGMNLVEVQEIRPFAQITDEHGIVREVIKNGTDSALDNFFEDITCTIEPNYIFKDDQLKEVRFMFPNGGSKVYRSLVSKYDHQLGEGVGSREYRKTIMWEREKVSLEVKWYGSYRGRSMRNVSYLGVGFKKVE